MLLAARDLALARALPAWSVAGKVGGPANGVHKAQGLLPPPALPGQRPCAAMAVVPGSCPGKRPAPPIPAQAACNTPCRGKAHRPSTAAGRQRLPHLQDRQATRSSLADVSLPSWGQARRALDPVELLPRPAVWKHCGTIYLPGQAGAVFPFSILPAHPQDDYSPSIEPRPAGPAMPRASHKRVAHARGHPDPVAVAEIARACTPRCRLHVAVGHRATDAARRGIQTGDENRWPAYRQASCPPLPQQRLGSATAGLAARWFPRSTPANGRRPTPARSIRPPRSPAAGTREAPKRELGQHASGMVSWL